LFSFLDIIGYIRQLEINHMFTGKKG